MAQFNELSILYFSGRESYVSLQYARAAQVCLMGGVNCAQISHSASMSVLKENLYRLQVSV